MKKTLKKTISAVLVLVMSLTMFTVAFARDETEGAIEWDGRLYANAGELKQGSNQLENYGVKGSGISYDATSDGINLFFSFNAEKTGYYVITTHDENALFDVNVAEQFDGEKAFGIKERVGDVSSEGVCRFLYYLNEGKNIMGDTYWFNDEVGDATINIEYYGDKISNLVIDENQLKDFVIGADLKYNDLEDLTSDIRLDATVLFSSGKELKLKNGYFECRFNSELAEGENKITLLLPEHTENLIITAYPIDHYIESITSHEKPVVYIDYNYNSNYISKDRDITVKFTNGKTETMSIYENVVIGGREYAIKEKEGCKDGNTTVSLSIAGKTYLEEVCEVERYGFKENLDKLNHSIHYDVAYEITNFKCYFSKMFSFGGCNTNETRYDSMVKAVEAAGNIVSMVVMRVLTFVSYYTTFSHFITQM